MSFDSRYIYVEGESPVQAPIRPHNWAERFAGNMASYGADRRLRYSNTLEPVVVKGVKCLRICRSLESSNPALLQEVLSFAGHYNLRVHGLNSATELLAQAS